MRDFFLYTRCLGALRQLPRPLCIGLETRQDPSYGQRGRDRQGRPHGIFQFTLSGQGVFRDAAGSHTIGPGQGFLCESHDPTIAYGYPEDGREAWRFVFIDFAGQAAHAITHDLVRRFGAVYELSLRHPVIERLLAFRVHDEVGCTLSPLEGSRLVTDLLHALLASKESAQNANPDHLLVRRVHDFIQANMANRITVSAIAEHLGISREHLTRVFAQYGGMSPYQYILSSKIEAACSLLRSGAPSVKEVAGRLGFDNVAHFARAFKRITRCTPGDFRQLRVMPEGSRLHTP